MKGYESKQALIAEINKTADKYIAEFRTIPEQDADKPFIGVDRTPYENLAYQLGWLELIQYWEAREKAGKKVEMPAPGVKWNRLGPLHEKFYSAYQEMTLAEMREGFKELVKETTDWLATFSDEELFEPGGRNWAQSTPSNWPVWKWVHINTVAPFKSFRTKIRKWKKCQQEMNSVS